MKRTSPKTYVTYMLYYLNYDTPYQKKTLNYLNNDIIISFIKDAFFIDPILLCLIYIISCNCVAVSVLIIYCYNIKQEHGKSFL